MKKVKKATTRGPSGLPCDRVRYPHKTGQSCACSMKATMKREGIRNVEVVRRGEYVILIRKDL